MHCNIETLPKSTCLNRTLHVFWALLLEKNIKAVLYIMCTSLLVSPQRVGIFEEEVRVFHFVWCTA